MKLETSTEIKRSDVLFALARVPQSTRLFVASSDANVYDIDTSQEKPEFHKVATHGSYVTGLALAGPRLISGAYDGRLIWTNIESGQQIRSVEAHSRWIRDVQVSRDGAVVASVADDMVCRLWSGETGELLRELKGHAPKTPHHFPSMLFACAFSADGALLATADKVGHVIVWDVETGEKLAAVDAPLMYTWDPKQRIHSIGGIRSLAFSPDSKLLATGGIGQIGNIDHLGALARVEIFDWQAGERTHEFPGDEYKGLVERLEFFPDGARLAAAGGDHAGFVKFFDLQSKKIVHQDKAPMHIHDFAVSEDFSTIYAAGHGKLVVWRMNDPQEPSEGGPAEAESAAEESS